MHQRHTDLHNTITVAAVATDCNHNYTAIDAAEWYRIGRTYSPHLVDSTVGFGRSIIAVKRCRSRLSRLSASASNPAEHTVQVRCSVSLDHDSWLSSHHQCHC